MSFITGVTLCLSGIRLTGFASIHDETSIEVVAPQGSDFLAIFQSIEKVLQSERK